MMRGKGKKPAGLFPTEMQTRRANVGFPFQRCAGMPSSAAASNDARSPNAKILLDRFAARFQGGFQLRDEFGEAGRLFVRGQAVVDRAQVLAQMGPDVRGQVRPAIG